MCATHREQWRMWLLLSTASFYFFCTYDIMSDMFMHGTPQSHRKSLNSCVDFNTVFEYKICWFPLLCHRDYRKSNLNKVWLRAWRKASYEFSSLLPLYCNSLINCHIKLIDQVTTAENVHNALTNAYFWCHVTYPWARAIDNSIFDSNQSIVVQLGKGISWPRIVSQKANCKKYTRSLVGKNFHHQWLWA